MKAVEEAHLEGVTVIGMTGKTGGRLKDLTDLTIIVPSGDTAGIQEAHITIGHIICCPVEKEVA